MKECLHSLYVTILGRKYLVLCTPKANGYLIESKKFKDTFAFDVDKEIAINKVKFLIEARVRLLLQDVIKVVEHGQSK